MNRSESLKSRAPVQIVPGSLENAIAIERRIPEFTGAKLATLGRGRLAGRNHLILIARSNGEDAGYKVGYALAENEFYSWVGGVLPQWRGRGIARQLLEHQERWVRAQGFDTIRVKSLNRFPGMLRLLIGSGYRIVGYDDTGEVMTSKIHFEKAL